MTAGRRLAGWKGSEIGEARQDDVAREGDPGCTFGRVGLLLNLLVQAVWDMNKWHLYRVSRMRREQSNACGNDLVGISWTLHFGGSGTFSMSTIAKNARLCLK